jgi:hypothetical protein
MGVREAITKEDRERAGASDVVCLGLHGMILRQAPDKLAMGFHVYARTCACSRKRASTRTAHVRDARSWVEAILTLFAICRFNWGIDEINGIIEIKRKSSDCPIYAELHTST